MTVNSRNSNFTFDRIQELKTELTALTSEQLVAIRLSHSYRLVQVWIRNMGWTNLFLGGLTLFFGTVFRGIPLLKTIQALIGLGTVLISVWSIISPLPIRVVMWAAVFAVAGVWNIFIAVFYQSLPIGIWGLFQLWWAYGMYQTFRKNAESPQPDADSLALYNELQHAIQKLARRDDDPDFIRLKSQRLEWQGFLLLDRIALAPRRGIALVIADRDHTTFTFKDGKGILRPRIAGTFDVEGLSGNKVTFPRSTFEHYNHWKDASGTQTVDWLNSLDLNTRKRRPIRIVYMLVLAAPFAFLLFLLVFAVLTFATYSN